jgi:tetratricopeptide (TPR) repeat protein
MVSPSVQRITDLVGDEAILDTAFAFDILTEAAPGRVEFSHPLLAAAAYAAVPPRQRRAIHTELAESAETVEERARHLALATVAPDPPTAEVIDAGAVAAAARAAPADAARLSEIAARLTPLSEPEARTGRRLAAASWHLAAGDVGPAVEIWTELAAACPPGEIHAEALANLANYGSFEYERALAMSDQAVAESTTVRSRVRRIAMHVLANSDNQRALEMLRAATAEARAAGDEVALAAVLPGLGFQTSLSTPGLDGLALLRESVQLERRNGGAVDAYGSAENRLGVVLVQRNELTEARELLRRHLDSCIARGDEGGSGGVAMHLSEAELRAGDLDRAQATIDRALAITDNGQPSQNLGMHLAFAALIATHRGEVDTARTLLKRLQDTTQLAGDPHTETAERVVAGSLELSLGNYAAALDWLEPTVAMLRSVGYIEPGVYFFAPDRLEALIATGRHLEAERDITEWEAIGRRYDRPFPLATGARTRGMLLAARGRLVEADRAFTEALAHHQRLDWPHQHARTLLAFGKTLRRAGRRRDARSRLQAALEIFNRIGEPLWADQTREEMGRLGGRMPSGRLLTDGERRVVELVAVGHSNREVAAELTISMKTVEAVLTRAYAKLNVRSRSELAASWPARR